eukprot:scaffold871_cov130-Cylindrotheca_fusiformis.AAC.37
MKIILLLLSFSLFVITFVNGLASSSFSPLRSSSNNSNNEGDDSKKPILVVGATGKVGRKVVQQLMDRNLRVRALVRNLEKANEIFDDNQRSAIEFVVCDLGSADASTLEPCVQGCEAIISVSGAMRFSKLTDFLPWRLFETDVSQWCGEDRSHPYFSNYVAQKALIDLAKKHHCSRFVRLTGLSSGFSPFNPVSMIFSSVLSLTSRYHFLCEQYLRNSNVPYLILRPGGLADEDRVDPSGSLPPPARVPRTDVAALAALAVGNDSPLDASNSYTLAIRAVGDLKPKPQGSKEEGLPTALDCLQSCRDKSDTTDKTIQSKPYGVAVGIFIYSLLLIGVTVAKMLLGTILSTIF